MNSRSQSEFRLRGGATIIVLIVLLASTAGVAYAGAPQPPTVGPAGTPPDVQASSRVTTPLQFFAYDLGEDYKLTPWQTREVPGEGMRKGVVEYAYELQCTSSRVHVVGMGKSTLGRPMIYQVITAPDNWARIDEFSRSTVSSLTRARSLPTPRRAR